MFWRQRNTFTNVTYKYFLYILLLMFLLSVLFSSLLLIKVFIGMI